MSAGYNVALRDFGREEMGHKLAAGEFDLFVGVWYPDPWLERGIDSFIHFMTTQTSPVPALRTPFVRERDRPRPRGTIFAGTLLDSLHRDAIMLPLFHMNTIVLIGPNIVTEYAGAGGVPELQWSWLTAGPR